MSQHIDQLFEKYLNGTCTRNEWEELLALISRIEENDVDTLSGPMMVLWEKARNKELPSTALFLEHEKMYRIATQADEDSFSAVGSGYPAAHRVHFLKTSWFRYAAAAVLIAGGAAVWYGLSRSARNEVATTNDNKQQQSDIQPGTNRAILTVGNKTIDLASTKTGITVNKGNTVSYDDGEKITDAAEMLTLETPRKAQYRLTLPDGSEVWLNAASSIRFPSEFKGAERSVEITGEVYMEIAKNSKLPFVVKANGTEIRVLGTSFNISAYSDEDAVKATLLEGSVKVTAHKEEVVLKPSEQAIIANADNNPISKVTVEASEVVAWKNGFFYFDRASFPSFMRQIGRWYDLDVHYAGDMPDRMFKGKLQRGLPLSSILNLLEKSGLRFKLEGKSLTVQP